MLVTQHRSFTWSGIPYKLHTRSTWLRSNRVNGNCLVHLADPVARNTRFLHPRPHRHNNRSVAISEDKVENLLKDINFDTNYSGIVQSKAIMPTYSSPPPHGTRETAP